MAFAALLGLAAGLIVVAAAILLLGQAARERSLIEERAFRIAQATIHQMEGEIRESSVTLRVLATSPYLEAGNERGFQRQLAEVAQSQGSWFAAMEADRPVAEALTSSSPSPFAARRGFDRLRLRVAAGAPQATEFACGSGGAKCWMLIARPAFQQGQPRRVLVNGLTAERLAAVVGRHDLPAGWSLQVFDRSGKLIARQPEEGASAGEPIETSLKAAVLGAGPASGPVWVGDSEVSAAYSKPSIADWTAVVGVPRAQALAPERQAWACILLFAVGVIAFILPVAWLVGGRLEKVVSSVGRLAAGAQHRADLAERRYHTYWRDSPECLFTVLVTPSGQFVFDGLNPTHEQLTGLSSRDLAGRTPDECLPPETAAAVSAHYRDCVNAGRPITYEETLDLPGGQRRWETRLSPLRDETGEIRMLLGSARDITERHELQTELAQSEARLRTVTEMVPDILFAALPGEVPDYFSPRFYEVTGVAPGSTPDEILSAVHPDDLRRGLAAWRRPMPDGRFSTEVRIRRRDGDYHWFLVRAHRSQGARGDRWYGVATDIHDLRTSNERITKLNDRLTTILESISDSYMTLDRDWRVTDMNPKVAEWLDIPASELLGADIRERLAIDPVFADAIQKTLDTGRQTTVENLSSYRPGRWIGAHYYPSPDGVSIFYHDITERRLAHARVEEARGLLQASLDAMGAYVALFDDRGEIMVVNEAWRRSLHEAERFQATFGVGEAYDEVCAATMSETDAAAVRAGVEDMLAGRRRSFTLTYETRFGEAAGWRQLRINAFAQGDVVHFIAAHEDVSEVAAAHAALRETSERLLSIQEEERQRIAVELHDSTSQHLVALGLGLAHLKRLTNEQSEVKPVLGDMTTSVAEALKEIRVLTYLLHPKHLARDGLETTTRQYIEGFGRRTGLETEFRAEGALSELNFEVQRTSFRVVQEALSNVHRHAAASRAVVELRANAFMLLLRVTDDGSGIDDPVVEDGKAARLGVGIPGMIARVRQLGGELTIGRGASGTVVSALIPIEAGGRAKRRARPGTGEASKGGLSLKAARSAARRRGARAAPDRLRSLS